MKNLLFNVLISAFLSTFFVLHINSSENMQLIVVPGQNGLGGGNLGRVLPQFTNINRVETPDLADFGQGRCLMYLRKALMDLTTMSNNKVLHASSQGTATALNYFAYVNERVKIKAKNNGSITRTTKNCDDVSLRTDNIKALILESVMLTGNSAIEHSVTQMMLPIVEKLPLHYYWLPYFAKFAFWMYSPAGRQAIFSVDHLPQDLPIIILHAPKDPQLSFKDSQALYAYLTTKGHEHVYFMSVENGYHVLLLHEDDDQTKHLRAILNSHGVLPIKEQEEELTLDDNIKQLYQPETQPEWINHFNDLRCRENRMWYIDWCVKGVFYGLLFYMLYQKCGTQLFYS